MANLYKTKDVKKADEIYNDLWINATQKDMQSYPEEFIEIMREKDRIVVVDEGDIKFDYTEFDFGVIEPYEEVECKFYFTNKSENRFVIHSVVTTCGCTVPAWNRQPIQPNGRDSISVKFKSNSKGFNRKTIIIRGNCNKQLKLWIKAVVA